MTLAAWGEVRSPASPEPIVQAFTSCLLTAMLFALSLRWAIRSPVSLLKVLRGLVVLLLAVVGVEIVCGFLRLREESNLHIMEIHRWLAHLCIVLSWASTLMGSATAFGKRRTIVNGMAGFGALLLCLLAAMSGYLPLQDAGASETWRFQIIHFALVPLLLTALLIRWLVSLSLQTQALESSLEANRDKAKRGSRA